MGSLLGCVSKGSTSSKESEAEAGRSFNEAILALRSSSSKSKSPEADPARWAVDSEVDPAAPLASTSSADFSLVLFVFDFDLTIAKCHMWGTYKDRPLDEVPVSNNTFVDLLAFQDFVNAVRDLGHAVAIATFGRNDVVNKAITHALGERHGVVISTPADHGYQEGSSLGSKNVQLQALADRFNVKLSQIRFFDDDERNIKEAIKFGVDSVFTKDGLTKAVLARAARGLSKHSRPNGAQ